MTRGRIDCEASSSSVKGDQQLYAPSPQQHLVLLCDPVPARRNQLTEAIVAMGAGHLIEASLSFDPEQLRCCDPIALVGIGGMVAASDPVLEWIARCKSAGSTVIAYADGAQKWPIRSKCLPFLAGAADLLDSGNPGFGGNLNRLLTKAFESLAEKHRERLQICSSMRQHGIVGESPAMASAFRLAVRFSNLSDLPVLITGDSGTGKELLARAIASMDPKREHGPFVAINCAAVNPALMESEFFGHRRGAFTGAERDRKGLIRAAEGGVLFLDEVGELDAGLQAKLLRVLQENRVLSVGEEKEVPVNVRFIAATNRNLEQLIVERKFRADLFHRLRVLVIPIPPLRDRCGDLAPLVEHFLQKHHSSRTNSIAGASEDFLEAVRQLDLPGNVRQLENLVCQAIVNHQSGENLDLNDLPADMLIKLTGPPTESSSGGDCTIPEPGPLPLQLPQTEIKELVKRILDGLGWNLSDAMRECERHVFHAAMQRAAGNQSRAARLLGLTPRSVYNKLRKYSLPD